MTQAKLGDTVKIHYTGTLDDETVFDTSKDRDPLQFTLGQGQVIPGFEQAVLGMSLGESKTTKIPAAQAYGPRDERMIIKVNRKQVPDHIALAVNEQLQIQQADGKVIVVTVTELSESEVTLDGNHPLAGQNLTFDIQLVEIG